MMLTSVISNSFRQLGDDGSTDRTFAILEEAVRRDSRIVAVSLSRNFGHQAALTAALDHVTGDAAVVMDGDLQDLPEVIPQFLEQYNQGYDVVYAKRVRRKEPWPLLSDIHLPLDSGDFGLMSRRVIDHVRRMPEHHRYLRGMRSWVGFRSDIATQYHNWAKNRSRNGAYPSTKICQAVAMTSWIAIFQRVQSDQVVAIIKAREHLDPSVMTSGSCAPNAWCRTRRYRPLPHGYQICLVFLKLRKNLCAPDAGILQAFPADQSIPSEKITALDLRYTAVVQPLGDLVEAVGLKAA
jgi:hypothetical protein